MINFNSPEFKRFQEIVRKNAEVWKRQIDLIAPYLRTFRESQRVLQEQMATFGKMFEKIALEVKRNWQPVLDINKNIIEAIAKTHKAVDSLVKDWQDFNKILFSLGWFPAGEWTAVHGRYIVKLYKEKKIKQLDKEIAEYYTAKRIWEIYEKWIKDKKLRRARLKILKDAIDAHVHRKYTLSIIVLLTQIEGEIRNYIEEYGNVGHIKLLKRFKTKLGSDKKDRFFSKTVTVAVVDTILKKLFQFHGVKKKTRKVIFTRHSVIHGINLRDFNRVNSTKLILLMNYIISKNVIV